MFVARGGEKKKSGLTDTSRAKTRAKKRKNETLLKTLSPNETRRGEGEIRPCVKYRRKKGRNIFLGVKETDEIEDGERTPKRHYWDTGTEVHVAYLRHPRRLGSTISCDKVAPDVSAGRAMHPPRRTNSLTPTRALYTRETRTSARVAVDRASLASYIRRLLCVRACASLSLCTLTFDGCVRAKLEAARCCIPSHRPPSEYTRVLLLDGMINVRGVYRTTTTTTTWLVKWNEDAVRTDKAVAPYLASKTRQPDSEKSSALCRSNSPTLFFFFLRRKRSFFFSGIYISRDELSLNSDNFQQLFSLMENGDG